MNQSAMNNYIYNQPKENNNSKKLTMKELIQAVFIFLYHCIRGIVLFFIPRSLLFKDVRGCNVLITGAGSGLGRGLSIKFAKLGATVVGVDLNLDGLKGTAELIEKNDGQFHYYECDISIPDNVYKMANQVEREIGFISILVNNAGVVTGKYFLNTNEKDVYKTFGVNTFAPFWTCKAFLPAMRERNLGHIVTISSMAGLTGAARLVDYCASKFAVVGLMESLRFELTADGFDNIKSTTVCPFYIHTGMFKGTKSRFIPILEQDYAVKMIMGAILSDQKLLIMPRIFYFMQFFRSMLPIDACDYIYEKIGGHSMMADFIGRSNNQSKLD